MNYTQIKKTTQFKLEEIKREQISELWTKIKINITNRQNQAINIVKYEV